jgi:DNA-directed RNA polymerase subunit D
MKASIEDDGTILKVKLEDSNEAVANALRRSMLTKVPTLSVSQVEIVKNESSLFDEMLAHRIGQVPFTIPQNVDEDDTVHIAVNKEGPGNVVAEDIKTDNDEAEPTHPEAVIASLKENQAVELEGEAEIGRGDKHAKHQGGTVGYEKTGEGEFLFRIESSSGYDNEELFNAAVEEVERELDELEEAVEDL